MFTLDIKNRSSNTQNQSKEDAWKASGLSEDFRDRFNSAWSAYDPDSVQDTFWDKAVNLFGARSSADVLRLQKDQARQEAINQLVNQKAEQDYNSESAKVQRERAAGLNPDLLGIGNASEATEGTEPQQRLDFSGLSTGKDLASTFMNVVDIGLGLFSGFENVRGLMIQNKGKEIEKFTSIQDLAKGIVDKSLLPPGIEILEKDPDSGLDKWQMVSGHNLDYDALVKQYGKDKVRYTLPTYMIPDIDFLRGKDRKAFDKELNRYKNSIFADANKYAEYYNYLNKRKDSAIISSAPFTNPSYQAMEDVFRPISKLMFDVNNASLKLQELQISNQQAYEGTFNATEAANADNSANLAHKALEDYNKDVNQAWKTASDAIQKFGEKNPVLGMIGIVLLNWLRSNMPMPNLPGSHHTNIYDNSNTTTNNEKVVNVKN